MKAAQNSLVVICVTAILLLVGACSGVPGGSTGGTGTGGGPFTISGSITGLAGTGLVLLNNGTTQLSITALGSFVFGTTVASGGTYNVTVMTQPSNPTQMKRGEVWVGEGKGAPPGLAVPRWRRGFGG